MADDRYRQRERRTEEMAQELQDLEEEAEEREEQTWSLWLDLQEVPARCQTWCGFTPQRFLELYALLEDVLQGHTGRGRRGTMSRHDRLLLLLVYLKHYETWDKLGASFSISKAQAKRLVSEVAEAALPLLWRRYVEGLDLDEPQPYPEFPQAVCLMDVTFQPCWTPAGLYDERKRFFSGKHKMYGLKSQCLHDLRGQVVHCVTGVPGAVHDVSIAQQNIEVLRQALRPGDPPVDVEGDEDMEPPQPEVMVDSGYQGLQHLVPCILPFKRRRGQALTPQQMQHNRRVARRRILVENYYGRLKQRHRIMCDKYRGERGDYALYFRLCVALTNFHVSFAPLRQE